MNKFHCLNLILIFGSIANASNIKSNSCKNVFKGNSQSSKYLKNQINDELELIEFDVKVSSRKKAKKEEVVESNKSSKEIFEGATNEISAKLNWDMLDSAIVVKESILNKNSNRIENIYSDNLNVYAEIKYIKDHAFLHDIVAFDKNSFSSIWTKTVNKETQRLSVTDKLKSPKIEALKNTSKNDIINLVESVDGKLEHNYFINKVNSDSGELYFKGKQIMKRPNSGAGIFHSSNGFILERSSEDYFLYNSKGEIVYQKDSFFRDISFTVDGMFLIVLERSGSGKSQFEVFELVNDQINLVHKIEINSTRAYLIGTYSYLMELNQIIGISSNAYIINEIGELKNIVNLPASATMVGRYLDNIIFKALNGDIYSYNVSEDRVIKTGLKYQNVKMAENFLAVKIDTNIVVYDLEKLEN